VIVAVTSYHHAVSPLFDTAQSISLFEVRDGDTRERGGIALDTRCRHERIALLVARGVQALICGAIGGHARRTLAAEGVQVYPWVSGDVGQVLQILASREASGRATDSEPAAPPHPVALASEGSDLESKLAVDFPRSRWLLLVREDASVAEVHQRPDSGWGADALTVARRIIDTPARGLLTGRCGPNLLGILAVGGVPVFLAPEDPARTVIEHYQRGELFASDLTGIPVIRQRAADAQGRGSLLR
jgi:predicted Fe-Mo cluster-binding NifX family protein